MTAVVVAGALANKPGSAGEAWVRMSWVRGLERLGLDVWFVEEIVDADESAVEWFRAVSARVVPQERVALIAGSETIVGPSLDDLCAVAAEMSTPRANPARFSVGLCHGRRRHEQTNDDDDDRRRRDGRRRCRPRECGAGS